MLSHVTLGVDDIEESIKLYDAMLQKLGYERHCRDDNWAEYGEISGNDINALFIGKPSDGKPATAGNGTNIALGAPTRQAVDEFHKTALSLGASDEGAPGIRDEIHPNFYAAYIRDLSGNKLLAVCHKAE